MLCWRCQARYMFFGPGVCCLALHLLCPVGGLGRAPFWHVFIPATVLCCNSKEPARHRLSGLSQVGSLHQPSCCTNASVARLPVGLLLVGAHSQLHLLVAQVIFVTAGTSHSFTARRSADLEEGKDCMVLSRRHQASTAIPHIAELWLGVGWALVAAAWLCLVITNSCYCCE